MKFLYAAYAITWVIHVVYFAVLGRGFARVKEEEHEFERER